MISKKKLLKKSRLYIVLDKKIALNTNLLSLSKKLAKAGADIIQLRDKSKSKKAILKEALSLSRFLKQTRTIFIVNDYVDIAKISRSDGLHIGQTDISIKEARKVLGKNKIIGVSCTNFKQALTARREGADYVGIGPIFKTKTKLNASPIGVKALKTISNKISIPIFAIGNINKNNLQTIKNNKITKIAVCGAVLKSKDIVETVKYFLKRLK